MPRNEKFRVWYITLLDNIQLYNIGEKIIYYGISVPRISIIYYYYYYYYYIMIRTLQRIRRCPILMTIKVIS